MQVLHLVMKGVARTNPRVFMWVCVSVDSRMPSLIYARERDGGRGAGTAM